MRERRRRLLTDDADPSQSGPLRLADGEPGSIHGYTAAGRAALQLPISSLVPLRRLTISLTLGACFLAIVCSLGLQVLAERLAPHVGQPAVSALELDAAGSLSRWLGSTLLGLAAAMSLFIYSLRRHRLDDYHGRYRVWLLMVAACVVLSIFENTAIDALVRVGIRHTVEQASLRFEVIWPLTVLLSALAVGGRLLLEIRRVWPAWLALCVATACFSLTAALYNSWPEHWNASLLPLWARGSWLVGYVMILASLLLYSRQVQLDVSGLEAPATKPKRKSGTQNAELGAPAARKPRKSSLRVRTDLDPIASTASAPAPERQEPQQIIVVPEDASIVLVHEDDTSTGSANLSRAERRKLKQQRRKAS